VVAPQAVGDIKVERDGTQRWLVVPLPPEQIWPRVRAFWQERGFAIASENSETGVMETDWAENRSKLPQDAIRSTIGRVLGSVYDTGERDRFRTRIERTATGSEVYISHRGMQENYTGEQRESTVWQPRPADPQLEAEFLSRLMVRLGTTAEVARTAVASAPEVPTRARALGGANAALEVDEPFDRAWRRVGLALDRSGFTVEDRDRTGGLYFVRYVDPKNAGKDEPGFFSRLFGLDKDAQRGPLRYRIALKNAGEKTQVSVLSSTGEPDVGENAQRIVGQLVTELR
jgi:outer membrane protein assembly factor BamC